MTRVASFRHGENGRAGFGVVEDRWLADCSGVDPAGLIGVLRGGELAGLNAAAKAERHDLTDITLLPPIPAPEKIICVGVNYVNRNEEYKDGASRAEYPSLFVRFPDSFVGHDQPILRPRESEQLDYE